MSHMHTDPPARQKQPGEDMPETVKQGFATELWLELKHYGGDNKRSLWLLVDGAWRSLDDPSDGIQEAVQGAFCECPNHLEVAVWYDETKENEIVGLVVRSPYKR